jgi:cell division protein ZapE
VADITDAMILHRLLVALFDNGVGFVTTSNFEPNGLYPDGLHRDRILPAIALLNQRMQVLNVDNGTDYRRRTLEMVKLYHTPLGEQADAEMHDAFNRLATGPDEDPVLQIEARQINAKRRAGDVVWFDFKAICGGPRSQNDYLEIATQYHTVLLSNVPHMPVSMASEARRFTWLIDVLYDRRVKLIMSAAVAPEALYTSGPMSRVPSRVCTRCSPANFWRWSTALWTRTSHETLPVGGLGRVEHQWVERAVLGGRAGVHPCAARRDRTTAWADHGGLPGRRKSLLAKICGQRLSQ